MATTIVISSEYSITSKLRHAELSKKASFDNKKALGGVVFDNSLKFSLNKNKILFLRQIRL